MCYKEDADVGGDEECKRVLNYFDKIYLFQGRTIYLDEYSLHEDEGSFKERAYCINYGIPLFLTMSKNTLSNHSLLIIYYSGHGIYKSMKYFPYDMLYFCNNPHDPKIKKYFPFNYFLEFVILPQIRPQYKTDMLFILDCCCAYGGIIK